ncbi:unnamed protein product [Orchesella dallaii]|uniref:G-protein coupled receptors family 2 profile 2 domain-containing protein n=1 Tax=Orchesella dallaii TaxID=48710 RepID=A0ABP1QGQ5_9HEXA
MSFQSAFFYLLRIIKMWGLHSPIMVDGSPWNPQQQQKGNENMECSHSSVHYDCNSDPLRITSNIQKRSKMRSHNSSTRSVPLMPTRAQLRARPSYSISLYIVVILVCFSLENFVKYSSAEPIVPRTARSSVIRPTRVTYGDIEKANRTCPPKDTCAPSRSDRNGALMNDWKKRNCFCDQQCIVYDDCCVDSSYRRDPNVTYKKSDNFQCVKLRQFGSLYMKTHCPANWKDEMIRTGCEEDKATSFDPVSSLPVTNMRSGFTFKNYYCAVCNNQTFNDRMELWQARLECPSITNKEEITPAMVRSRLVYRSDQGSWGLTIPQGDNDIWHSCKIDPVIPDSATDMVRHCRPAIRDCPSGYNNTEIHRKCLSYTAQVYHIHEGYRNVHCAICNGIAAENLICTPSGLARSGFTFEFNQGVFSFLFDLNPESGNLVGQVEKCSSEQVYDPFFKRCRSVLCAPGQVFRGGECVTISVSTSTPANPNLPSDNNELGDGNDLSGDGSNVLESTSPKDEYYSTESVEAASVDEFDSCPKIMLGREEYEILNNGTVFIEPYGKYLKKSDYVVQGDNRLVVCAIHTKYYTEKFGATWGYLSFVGVLISVICIILHLIASCIVPELRNLSGKNLASLCVALLIAYSVFLGMPFVRIPSHSCTVMAVILYYSLMASFCWMLVLAWDVCMTLRRATQELRVSSGSQWMRFFFYSTFGWLFPAILVTLAVVAEFLPADMMPWPYSPSFGRHNCWFGQKQALLIYFAGPVAFILVLNVILFIDSARLIASTSQGTAKAKACGPSHRNFQLYLRLALLMGISWVLGIVAGYVDIPELWIIFIVFNTLQGLFIFVAFTLSPKVRKVLRTKLCCASTIPAASWTWSGVGGHHMARATSSSSGHTKRSDIDPRDSSDSSHHSPYHTQHGGSHHNVHHPSHLHHQHIGHPHHQHHSSLHAIGSGKMYRAPSVELYRSLNT